MYTAAPESAFDLTIKRNCSISPQDLLRVLALVTCVSLGIGIGFACVGAWPVLPFAGLEIVALVTAFYLNGRHAADYERIALAGGSLLVQSSRAGRTEHHEFALPWLRLETRRDGADVRVLLRSRGSELEIGRHLDAGRRASLAAQLQHRITNS